MDNRAELKRQYKETLLPMGVYQIRNKVNGKIFIGNSLNLDGSMNRARFELNFGKHRNQLLQSEWNEYGAENFEFEKVDQLKPGIDPEYDYREDLTALQELWLEKLQPYGDKGYHLK